MSVQDIIRFQGGLVSFLHCNAVPTQLELNILIFGLAFQEYCPLDFIIIRSCLNLYVSCRKSNSVSSIKLILWGHVTQELVLLTQSFGLVKKVQEQLYQRYKSDFFGLCIQKLFRILQRYCCKRS